MSRSLRARGLKQLELDRKNNCLKSRSLRARGLKLAWLALYVSLTLSRSLRARGLKLGRACKVNAHYESRSLRARGLKQSLLVSYRFGSCVALFTGAWIETLCCVCYGLYQLCRALYGRVD